ncbi:DUF1573 domain-containing protein [Sphingobacterium siyangense]|uniref:DUF1573 domain-containing protein n=1 Tax=Sphingobacterium siyangense TaxID=459529 RepID=UPI002FDA4146
MKKSNSFLLLSVIFILICCRNKSNEIYQNKTDNFIDSLAVSEGKAYCVILIDTSRYLSKEYINSLNSNLQYISEKAIINIIDVSEDNYIEYLKLLQPKSLPLACIFNKKGELFDLIPGYSKESFLYINEAVSHLKTTDYHWPNLFGTNKTKVLPVLSAIFNNRKILLNPNSKIDKFVTIPNSVEYPFSVYVNLLIAKSEKDSLLIKQQAKKLLKLKNSMALQLYKNEFIEAEKVLDLNFDVNEQANIRVETKNIKLENCRINQSYPIDIVINNDGSKPLRLEKIWNSCSCVRLLGEDKNIVVKGKTSYIAKFEFTPLDIGEVYRDIYIESEAYNNPSLNIKIQAIVNQ